MGCSFLNLNNFMSSNNVVEQSRFKIIFLPLFFFGEGGERERGKMRTTSKIDFHCFFASSNTKFV